MIRPVVLLTLGLMVSGHAVAQGNKVDPPGTAPIMAQYRQWFSRADANKDDFLDKQELARVFRGPTAKPFDAAATKPAPTDKTEDKSDSEKERKPEAPNKNYANYVDYQFLVQLDTDKDEQVSKAEFEAWARDLAVQVKAQLDAQQQLLALQARIAQETNKARAVAERKKNEEQMQKLQGQLKRSQERQAQLERNFRKAQHDKQEQDRKRQQELERQRQQELEKKRQQDKDKKKPQPKKK